MNTDLDLTITRGKASDIEAIVRFQADMAMESEGTMLDMDRLTLGVTSAINDEQKGTYLVARANDTPIGSLMVTREWSDWNNMWYWWIQSVYVMPEYRNQGVYRAMYTTLKDMAKENGVSQVRLYADRTNHSAQQVYRRLGMTESHYLMFEETIGT
ncbi:MAG: GNAT family N-acetyltransferase [Bacteroidaceae bacterium]|nr:GNAT family N-acetyltransferase [Bacteroidaceae bacterium]